MAESNKYLLRQTAAFLSLVAIGLFFLYSLKEFVGAALGALIFYVILVPPLKKLHEHWKFRKIPAVLLLMILSFIVILVPAGLLTIMLSTKVNYVLNHSNEFLAGLHRLDQAMEKYLGFEILTDDTLQRIKNSAAGMIPAFLNKSVDLLSTIALLYFFLYFLLMNQGWLEAKMEDYLPLKKSNARLLISEMRSMIYSNVLAAPLLAIIQGLFAWFGFWMFDLPEPLFWGIICGLFSFVPVVGTTMVWIPAGMFQYTAGLHWQGIAILIYGVLIITNVDNVFRFVLQKKIADVHPLITLVGVIMGLNLIGFTGIIFGPLFISWYLILVRIYRNEFVTNEKQEQQPEPGISSQQANDADNKPL